MMEVEQRSGHFSAESLERSPGGAFLKRGIKNLVEQVKQPLPEFPQLWLLGDKSFIPAALAKAAFGLAWTGFIFRCISFII